MLAPITFPQSNPAGWIIHKSIENLVVCEKLGGTQMKASSAKSFSKQLSCPSSSLLLSFRRQTLAPEVNFLVKNHLAGCDFCYCELPLLAMYTPPGKGDCRTPELPINLRVLAESILGQANAEDAADNESAPVKGLRTSDVEV